MTPGPAWAGAGRTITIEAPDTMTPDTNTQGGASELRAHVSRKWTIRMALIGAGLIAFGLWGLYDATVAYPSRGSEAAEFLEYQYLQQMSSDPARSSIAEPRSALQDLRAKYKASGTGAFSAVDKAKSDWLEQLDLIGKLEPATASTVIPRTDFRAKTPERDNAVKDPGQRL